MTLNKLIRAYNRLRYMKDYKAYSDFLVYMDTYGDIWKASQAEVAGWWKFRQKAIIALEVTEKGRLRVGCSLSGCVIEVDGKDLKIPPFETPISTDIPIGSLEMSYYGEIENKFEAFVDEILGHLGYGHVKHGTNSSFSINELDPLLQRLRNTAIQHWRYDADDIQQLRTAIRNYHHDKGIPELRIWTLPHIGNVIQRVCVSTRFDVDRAIVNLPFIHELEDSHNCRSTVYLRPSGYFYGEKEISNYANNDKHHEIALHGEFVSTAERKRIDELAAAKEEKELLQRYSGKTIRGVCMHGGELRTNYTERTWEAIEAAGFEYETLYRNRYYLPLHLPCESGVRNTLSIGQRLADISTKPDKEFAGKYTQSMIDCVMEAREVGGVFVPVMHPQHFDFANYLRRPVNIYRLALFFPRYLLSLLKMKPSQEYLNRKPTLRHQTHNDRGSCSSA